MILVKYPLSAFVNANGQIFLDSLDNDVAGDVSLGPDYLYAVYVEANDPAESFVEFYFSTAINGSQQSDLDDAVASYGGQPGYTGSPGQYLVANLPMRACNPGDSLWAIDGRKVGEGPGNGTGVPVYWSATEWLVFSTDTPVQT